MEYNFEEFYAVAFTLLTCNGSGMLRALDAFEAYAREKFEHEDEWMLGTGYPLRELHSEEHAAVLGSAQHLRRQVMGGQANVDSVHDFATCLFKWFPKHADYLDAALTMWVSEHHLGGELMALRQLPVNEHKIL